MTFPNASSAEENFDLNEGTISPPADAVGQGTRLNFLLLFPSREKVKKNLTTLEFFVSFSFNACPAEGRNKK